MAQPNKTKPNELHDLGYKIFLDRYAQKDMTRETLAIGDTVIVVVNSDTGQREVGKVTKMDLPTVTIKLNDGEVVERDIENVDKPLETDPGQMMDRVARGIAEIEKNPKARQKWQDQFRWLLDDWKFVTGGRILAAAGTDQELTFYNCMPPEQEILTKDGYRPIADVSVGDYVVTHKNRLRKVLHKFERDTQEDIYIIKPKKVGYDDLRVTGEHKILVIRSEWVNTHRSRDGLKLAQEPQWIPAKDLKPSDFVAVAYDGERKNRQVLLISDYIGIAAHETETEFASNAIISAHGAYEVNGHALHKATTYANGTKITGKRPLPLNNELAIDNDLAYLFGRWLGDGCITHRTGTDIPSGIKIVFNLQELSDAEEIARIIEDKFGIVADIKMSSTERWYDLWVNSMPVGEFFKALLGHYSHSKVMPDVLMRLADEYTLALLRGLFRADGYISSNKIGMLLANRTLTTQVHQLLLRLGYFFSINENTHKNGRTPAYRLEASANECGNLFEAFFDQEVPEYDVDLKYYIEYDDLKWTRIGSIEVEDYRGQVLDIEVEEDHSFVSAGVVVSNCYVVPSPQDSREGIMQTLTHMTEIMSRGGGVGINISTLRPRSAYVKGVNGRSSGSVSWGALYSFVTGLIEQGGCFCPDERIATDKGLIPSEELADRIDAGETFYAHTHKGLREVTARFRNGVKPLYEVTTDRGYKVRITEDHKVAVLMDGKITTMPLKYLQEGDEILLLLSDNDDLNSMMKDVHQRDRSDAVATKIKALPSDLVFHTEKDTITSIIPIGNSDVFDFEVDDVHLLSGNGIYTSNSRRGALMLILNDWHPDVFDFINSKRQAGQITNANISVGVSDQLMDAVKADADWDLVFPDTSDPDYDELWDGDLDTWAAAGRNVIHHKTIKARELWDAMIESAWASAEPGVWFRERSNKMANSWYFNPLISTNPCVTGDTRIYTDKGLVTARELFDDETDIQVALDGRFGVEDTLTTSSRVFMTGVKQVYRLQTKEGYHIRATADHRIMTPRGWVEVQNLNADDEIHVMNRKGGFGQEGSLELGRVLGWLVGDGTMKADRAVLSFFGEEKQELAPVFAGYVNEIVAPMTTHRTYEVGVVDIAGRDEARVQSDRLRQIATDYGLADNKHQVPEIVFKGTEDMQRGYLQALFTADGSFQGNTTNGTSVRLAANSLELLEQVQILLGNFGIASRIYRNRRDAGYRSLPDGNGGLKEYWCEAQHELAVRRQNLVTFVDEIGFLMAYKQDALTENLANRKRAVYSEKFTATIESITEDGIEEVFDLTVPQTHSFVGNSVILHNCGEQPLGAWSVCNLGAINLSRFYDEENNDADWAELDKAVRVATRFLDNVIDTTPYFFQENADMQQSERRVGLGTMGIAELMLDCGIRYGSDESVEFIEKVYKSIAVASYETSSELAVEKGAFPKFDAEKYLESGYMQQMPETLRDQIRQNGVRNVTLLTQAPTGCVAPDTLVSTREGLTPIVELGDANGAQWQIMPRDVHTDIGIRKASHFYINGEQPVKRITTKRGFTITATHNHRLRVIDATGNYVWRRMDELNQNDRVVLKRGTLTENSDVMLTSVAQAPNSKSDLPDKMSPEFAELLGLYMGDGYTKQRGGLHIVIAHNDPDLLDYVKELLQKVWGERHIGVEDRTGCWIASLTGYYIPRFFEANNMQKPSGNEGEGAAGAFIPLKVLQAGKDAVTSFLRGLFEADGSVHRGTITLSSTSKKLIEQVQVALLGLGIVSTVREMPEQSNRYGSRPIYELRMINRREAQRFVELVGFISDRKQKLASDLGLMSDRGDTIVTQPLIQEFYAHSQGLPNDVRQTIIGRVSNGALTQQFVKEVVADHSILQSTRLAKLVDLDIFVDAVATIDEGVCHTYDISVPDNHTYIANGFVSHNTTGTMVNTSTGIEPFFSWVYYRKSRLGLHEEQVPIVARYYEENPDAEALPEHFVTAMDLAPEEHVKVQGAFQRWIDSAISKTCNVPNEYTVEQVSELYEMMYDLGCKGGTIYRDGSRSEQVLMLKKEDEVEETPAQVKAPVQQEHVTTPHRVYPRPSILNGTTVRFNTPFGKSYITMNSDDLGNPFEVFITVGKAGSDIQADAEALGRMISLQLRTTAPNNRREMLKLVVEQLSDIGGARPMGFGPNRILSLPDAVGRALLTHYFNEPQPQQLGLPIEGQPIATPVAKTQAESSNSKGFQSGADMCPDCGTISLIRAEGCRKCLTCGYSEC
ncbi:MAG: LAGLIDADG family homing endonuclease [Phototrophicaceae bacterium]